MLETVDYTLICIGSTSTFLYFDLYLYSAYAAHYVYLLNILGRITHVLLYIDVYDMLHYQFIYCMHYNARF